MAGLPRDELSRVRARLSERLGLRLAGVSLIKDNGVCRIYQAFASGEPVIVKQYRGHDATLVRREAEAIDLYERICEGVPDAIPSRTLVLNVETNTLCMAFVHGRPLSEIVERARDDVSLQRRCAHALELTGDLVRRIHDATRDGSSRPSRFLYEYMSYVSGGLECLPILGRTIFRGYRSQADELWYGLLREGEPPSTCHGDLALTNIRMRGYRVGLIDFANTSPCSHVLGDLYGLTIYLLTRHLPDPFRRSVLDSLYRGIGPSAFPDAVHRFHWEMQRRRWLFLKLVQGNGLARLDGLRALSDLGMSLRGTGPCPLPA